MYIDKVFSIVCALVPFYYYTAQSIFVKVQPGEATME